MIVFSRLNSDLTFENFELLAGHIRLASWLVDIRMTHVRHDSLIWLIDMTFELLAGHIRLASWFVDMSHTSQDAKVSYDLARRQSLKVSYAWLLKTSTSRHDTHICDMTHSYGWHGSLFVYVMFTSRHDTCHSPSALTSATWRIHMWHDAFTCDTSRYVWGDSFIFDMARRTNL